MRLYKALMAALPHRAAPSENQTQDPAGPGTLLVQGPCWSKDPAGPRTLLVPGPWYGLQKVQRSNLLLIGFCGMLSIL